MQIVFTFFLAVIGWIIFRAESMTQAIAYLRCMLTNDLFDRSQTYGISYLGFGLLLLAVEWLQREKQHALQFSDIRPFCYRPVRWAVYYAILLIIAKFAGTSQTFIYVQF